MTADDLIALAQPFTAQAACAECSSLVCPGWESLPGGFDRSLVEYHPTGTHGWSADAPIATEWFPYNRCDVLKCIACGRPFLHYTEFGGYYTDERIREIREHLIERPVADPGIA
jgi:hypothetical protein